MDDPERPVTRAELAKAVELLREYSQAATLMMAASIGGNKAGVAESIKQLNAVTEELIHRFGADIPRG